MHKGGNFWTELFGQIYKCSVCNTNPVDVVSDIFENINQEKSGFYWEQILTPKSLEDDIFIMKFGDDKSTFN